MNVWLIEHTYSLGKDVFVANKKPSMKKAINIINNNGGSFNPEMNESVDIKKTEVHKI